MKVEHEVVEKTRIHYWIIVKSVVVCIFSFFFGYYSVMDSSIAGSYLSGIFIALFVGVYCKLIWWNYKRKRRVDER
jgi:hypothetical protein